MSTEHRRNPDGSRAWQQAMEGARRATEPMIRHIVDMHLMYGTTRIVQDAAGVVTVENTLPPEIQERVDKVTADIQEIRTLLLETALGHAEMGQ